MATTKRRYSKEELARRGNELYEREIKPLLTKRDNGKFLAIDIESGDYELDKDELQACQKLGARVPDAQMWLMRVGYHSVHRFGGRNRRERQ